MGTKRGTSLENSLALWKENHCALEQKLSQQSDRSILKIYKVNLRVTSRRFAVRCFRLRCTRKKAIRAANTTKALRVPPTMPPTLGLDVPPLDPDEEDEDDDGGFGVSLAIVGDVAVRFDEKTIESKMKSAPFVREVITNEWFPLARSRLDW